MAARRCRARRARRPGAEARAPRAGATGCTRPRAGCRRFPESAPSLRLLDGRDGRRDLDGGGAPVERAARVDEQAVVPGLALAAAADRALELDLERLVLYEQVAAEGEALVVDRLDGRRLESNLGMRGRVEEVRRRQVRVALLLVGAQRLDADRARD